MKEGDKCIWNSGFGYDIGTFVGPGIAMGMVTIIPLTGKRPGIKAACSEGDVKPFSDLLNAEMAFQYGYDQTTQLSN